MKRIILSIFVSILFLSLISAVSQQEIFVLTLQYKNETVSLNSLIVTEGVFYPPISTPQTGYNLSLISLDDKTLYSQIFDFNLVQYHSPPDPSWFDDDGNQIYFGSRTEGNENVFRETTLELILPYSPEVARIEIKNKSNANILSIPVNGAPTAINSSEVPCIIVSCVYAPQTCPNWGAQERTCTDSCTNKKVKEKINCTPGTHITSTSSESIWQKIGNWFRNLFGG